MALLGGASRQLAPALGAARFPRFFRPGLGKGLAADDGGDVQATPAGDRDLARELGPPSGIGAQLGDTGMTEGGDFLRVAVAEAGLAVRPRRPARLQFDVRLAEIFLVGGAAGGIEPLFQSRP